MIDKVISSLKDEFLLEREEDMAGFLGLQILHDWDTDTIALSQTGLIDTILDTMEICTIA